MPKKLIFKIGEESIPTILSSQDYNESPFEDTIDLGKRRLRELVLNGHNYSDKTSEHGIYSNNIISFLGDRGSGKTSCLLSVIDLFKTEEGPCGKKMEDIACFLPIIDPSFFDDKHNILDIFIGELYHSYKNLTAEMYGLGVKDREKIKALHSKFRKTKQAICYLNETYQESPIDEVEELARLSEGVELNRIMKELIDTYLETIEKKCLVISIDDLDLNVKESYRMMEQIRKFLVLPKVVILMAAKPEQLRHGICLVLTEYYKNILDKYLSQDQITEKAERYLAKFLPVNQRIYMPEPEKFMHYGLEIVTGDKETTYFDTVEFAVLSLIFQKTRYLFYNHDGETSLIVPRNLRELRHLVTNLFKMQMPETPEIHSSNKQQFSKYFKEQWIQTLTLAQQRCINTIFEETNISKLNKLVITQLYCLAKNLKVWSEVSDKNSSIKNITRVTRRQLEEVVNPANNPINVSIGDVLLVMNLIREYEDSEEIRRLLFCIRTYYSMQLYELYDEMSRLDKSNNEGFIREIKTPSTIPVLRKDNSPQIPDYFLLVGGGFFTLSGNTFLPYSANFSREVAKIDGSALRKEIAEIVKRDNELIKNNEDADDGFLNALRLLEFFMLASRRNLYDKKAIGSDSPDSWRTNTNSQRFSPFTNVKNILFDISSVFVNMIYPKYAYDRFSEGIYAVALRHEKSVLRSVLDKNRLYEGTRNRFVDLMSRVTIRNMEVLDDLYIWLSDKKDSIRPSGNGVIGVLETFYKFFSNQGPSGYSVKTYDRRDGNKDFYTITFSPVGELASVLNTVEQDEYLKKLFNKIYASNEKLVDDTTYNMAEIQSILSGIASSDKALLDESIRKVLAGKSSINSIELVRALAQLEPGVVVIREFADDELVERYKLESLSIAKNKIAHYREYEDELKGLLAVIDRQLDEVKKGVEICRIAIERITTDKQRLSLQRMRTNQNLKKLERKQTQWLQRSQELESELKSLNDECKNIEELISQKSQQLRNAKISTSPKRPEKPEIRWVFNPQSEEEATKRIIVGLENELASAKNELERLNKFRIDAETESKTISYQLVDADSRSIEYVHEINECTNKARILQNDLKSQEQALSAFENQRAELEARRLEKNGQYEEALKQREKAEKNYKELNKRLENI